MCIPWKKHIAAALILCLPLLLIGCGGGGGGGGASRVISGVAVKGPIANGLVAVYRLTLEGTRGEQVGSGTTAADGSYAVKIPASVTGPVVVTVTGRQGATYESETTGENVPFTAADSLSAVVENFDPAVPVAVTPLTEMAFQKLPLILDQKAESTTVTTEVLQSAVQASNTLIGDLFNVTDILAPPQDGTTYDAALIVIDQMIVASQEGAGVTDTTAVMGILTQAVVELSPTAPAYQTFVDAFTSAATDVVATEPTLATTVNSITQQVTTPPTEPVFSDLTPPTVATGLAATTYALTSSTSSVVLTWFASTDQNGVAGYDVYRNGVKVGTAISNSFTDQPVTSNVTYAYTVVAFDAAGNFAAASAPLSVKPNQASLNVTVSGQLSGDLVAQLDLIAPSAPTGLAAVTTAISGTNSSVALSWSGSTDNIGVTGYDVFRDGVKIGTVTSTSYTDASVTSAVTYAYTVKAFDKAGNRSAASTALSVTPNRASLGVTVSGQVNP